MDLNDDYFTLFDLERGFSVNTEALSSRYRELQRQYHPDRFAHDPGQQKQAVEWTAHLNQAYQTLAGPVLRAAWEKLRRSAVASKARRAVSEGMLRQSVAIC